MSCKPDCDCKGTSGDPSYIPTSTPPGGRGVPLCWGVAGAEASVAAGATATLTITVANYSWLKPRQLRLMAQDPAVATAIQNSAVLVTVNSVTGIGRQVIGSAGINGGALDAYADRSLSFGRDISPITSANSILVSVTNNGPAAMRIAVAIEGEAQQ